MIFVGERPSPKAARYGHSWVVGQAAGATLHRALASAGVSPASVSYENLWSTPGLGAPRTPPSRAVVTRLRVAHRAGEPIIGMGCLVQRQLARLRIPCAHMRHPAARGALRRRDLFDAHVAEVLSALPSARAA